MCNRNWNSTACYARSFFAPISPLSLFAIPGDRTPNLTMILITTDHYTPYPRYHSWSRPIHSLIAIHHLDSHTALWLSACCPFHEQPYGYSPHGYLMSTTCLPHGYLMVASCSPHGDPHHHVYRIASHLGASCISSPLHLHSITPICPYTRPMFPSCYPSCIPHGSYSSYRVWSTYLGYAPHDSLMYYSIGYL